MRSGEASYNCYHTMLNGYRRILRVINGFES